MTQIANYRIKEYSKSTGTGDFITTAAVSNQRRFSTVCSVGDNVFYSIVDSTNSTWETGLGVYSAANTISRVTVKNSSNANALVNFGAGTKTIEITSAASDNEYHTSVKPTLNLDFVKTEVLDPRITFTRNTIATRYNSKGLLETVASNVPRFDYDTSGTLVTQNLLWYSSFAGTLGGSGTRPTGWGGTGVNGSAQCALSNTNPMFTTSQVVELRKISASGLEGIQLNSSQISLKTGTYTISCYVRVPTGLTAIDFIIYVAGGVPGSTTFVTAATLDAQPKDTWVKYSTTITFTVVPTLFSLSMGSGTVGAGFDITAPQINNGSAVLPFIPSTTTVSELWTSTNSCKGLLIEEARTNYFTNSTLIAMGYNSGTNVATPNYGIAPDGTTTSLRIVMPTSQTINFGSLGTTLADVISTTVTHSVFMKPKGVTASLSIYVGDGTSTGGLSYTCTLTSGIPTLNNSGIVQNVGNGWFRLIMPYTPTIANGNPNITVGNSGGNGITVDIEWWGAQREVGGFATSYIPTGASVVTRNKEDVNIVGSNFSSWYNKNEGTFIVGSTLSPNGNSAMVLATTPVALGSYMALGSPGSMNVSGGYTGGSANGQVSSYYQTGNNISSIVYDLTKVYFSANGGIVNNSTGTDYTGTNTTGLVLGTNTLANRYHDSHIQTIKYYNKALPTNIQAMTA